MFPRWVQIFAIRIDDAVVLARRFAMIRVLRRQLVEVLRRASEDDDPQAVVVAVLEAAKVAAAISGELEAMGTTLRERLPKRAS